MQLLLKSLVFTSTIIKILRFNLILLKQIAIEMIQPPKEHILGNRSSQLFVLRCKCALEECFRNCLGLPGVLTQIDSWLAWHLNTLPNEDFSISGSPWCTAAQCKWLPIRTKQTIFAWVSSILTEVYFVRLYSQ